MGSRENANGTPFFVNDRVIVTGGCDRDPDWLQGAEGYRGTIQALDEKSAVILLDSVLELPQLERADPVWRIWGSSLDEPARISQPRGRWLFLRQGWTGSVWNEPTDRLHVILCEEEPSLESVNPSRVRGAWVESHAIMRRVPVEVG